MNLNQKPKLKLNKLLLFLLFPFFFLPFSFSQDSQAATFNMQTGYYIGNGGTLSISGLGFQPEFVWIKSNTSAGSSIWKTSAMPANSSAFLSATANNTSTLITLNADGFTLANNGNTNSSNVSYNWVAFAGSDCSASGTICVGTYTGNGTSPRAINIGFTPAFVIVKQSTAVAGNFRTTSMANNRGEYFTNTAANTAGGLFTTLDASGFTVGATNNTNAALYYYVAFKSVPGAMNVGTYAGTGADNRNISGVGFIPEFVLTKNSTSATANNRIPYMNFRDSFGDYSSRIDGASANASNIIQSLQNDGFQVGTGVQANENLQTIYYAAFDGAPAHTASGNFKMETGTYTGNGGTQNITGLGFTPNLVIIKDNSTGYGIFRTSLMKGDSTAYLANALANLTTAITSLGADGFTVGANANANSNGITYHWQAFGNAWSPETKSGSTDFTIGAYMGNGIDNRNIVGLPFQPNAIGIKRNGASVGAWRTSSIAGDLTNYFSGTAEASNAIQSISAEGFQIGTAAETNTAANLYHWFAFAHSDNFNTGNFTGNGSTQNITTPGFKPDLVWIKRNTSLNGVNKSSSINDENSQFFVANANALNLITTMLTNGFSIGSGSEVNTNTGTYRYLSWKISAISTVGTEDNQTNTAEPNDTNRHIGTFTIQRDYGTTNLTNLTISETGTINATNDLSNIDIYHETTANCSYDGNENLFGQTANFNGSQKATISGSTSINSSQTCLYVVLDVLASAQDGQTIELAIADPSTEVTVEKGWTSPSSEIAVAGTTTINGATPGSLEVEIVDDSGLPVGSPTITMTSRPFSFTNQTASGTLGNGSEKIRINNTTQSAPWTLSVAASSGGTAFWNGPVNDYDFNDPTAGVGDGADADSIGGQMTINPLGATITPQAGCNNTGLTLGSSAAFSQGIIDSITLLTANGTASTNCYWDLTSIGISQTVPSEQIVGNYNIDMTLTLTAN